MDPHAQLLTQVAHGDRQALGALYRALEKPVFRFVLSRSNDPFELSDILHDVFMEVWRSAGRFEGRSKVQTWIFGIAYRKVIDLHRKRWRQDVTDDVPEVIDDDADTEACLSLRRRQSSGWVFPAPTGKTGYLNDPRKSIAQVRIASGVQFTPHDLRRTFTSLANGMDISIYTVKALLNHQLNTADVTAGYDVPDLERLQAASARIEDKFLRLAGVDNGNVVPQRMFPG